MTRTKARDPFVNASGSTISGKTAVCTRKCLSCLKTFQPKHPRQRFCVDRCRLFSWAVSELLIAKAAGKIDGLREKLKELGEVR